MMRLSMLISWKTVKKANNSRDVDLHLAPASLIHE